MRAVIIAFVLVAISSPALCEIVLPSDVGGYVGKNVTVEGVVQVHRGKSGVIFIDMGGIYPDSTFTGFIPEASTANLPDALGYTGKTIDITGIVTAYKGKPEIVVTDASQIAVK